LCLWKSTCERGGEFAIKEESKLLRVQDPARKKKKRETFDMLGAETTKGAS